MGDNKAKNGKTVYLLDGKGEKASSPNVAANGKTVYLTDSPIRKAAEAQEKAREQARQKYIYADADTSSFTYKTVSEYDTAIAKLQKEMDNTDPYKVAFSGRHDNLTEDDVQRAKEKHNELSGQIDRLKAERNLLERSTFMDNKYGFLRRVEDYAEYSVVDPRWSDENAFWKQISKKAKANPNAWQGYGATIQVNKYINDINGYREYVDNMGTAEKRESSAGAYVKDEYLYLTSDEIADYNYLFNKFGSVAADKYLSDLMPLLQKRYTAAEEWDTQELYEDSNQVEKLFMNAVGIAVKPIGTVAAAVDDIEETLMGTYSPYGSGHAIQTTVDTIRDSTGRDIYQYAYEITGSNTTAKLFSTAYQAGMSAADAVAGGLTLGKGYLVLAGADAATHKAKELYESGAEGWQIAAGALASGVLEAAIEKLPLDKAIKMAKSTGGFKDLVKGALRQMGIEGTEEAATEISNIIADSVLQGGNSDLSRQIAAYEKEGLTHEQAKKKAFCDKASDAVWAFVGGMAAGTPTALAFGSVGTIQNHQALSAAGTAVMQDAESTQAAINEGLSTPQHTQAYKQAEALAKKVDAGKSVSPYKMGQMLQQTALTSTQQAKKLATDVRVTAQQYGVAQDVTDTVAAIAAGTGRQIVFGELTDAGGDNTKGGQYNPNTGVITINPKAATKDVVEFLVKHELTHSVQDTRQWEQLADIAEAQLGDEVWSSQIAEVMETYSAQGETIDLPQAEREVVANWIGKNLYKVDFAKAIVKGDATVGNAMVRAIDRLRLALGNKNSRANANLRLVERLFMRALEQEQVTHEGDVEYSVYRKDIYDDIYYPKDPIMAEAFDRYMADKTMGLKNGQRRNILLSVGMTAYFVEADGYLTGNIAFTMPILGNEAVIAKKKEAFEGATRATHNGSGENADTWSGDLGVRFQRGSGGNGSSSNRRGASGTDVLYGGPSGSDEIGYSGGDHSDAEGLWDGTEALENYVTLPNGVITNDPQVIAEYYTNNDIADEESSSRSEAETSFSNAQNSIVNRAWLEGDTSVDMYGRRVERPVSQSAATADPAPAAQPVDAVSTPRETKTTPPPAVAVTSPDKGRQGGTYDPAAVERATDAESAIDALGDEEAYRRLHFASQIDRPRGSVELEGMEMSANEYAERVYAALPSDPDALRAKMVETGKAYSAELTRLHQEGKTTSSTALRLNIQLFAQKAKLDYVLDPGENGKKARQFYEKRLRGTDANHHDELVEMLKGHSETYNPIANEKMLNEAKDKLRNAEYQKDLLKRITKFNSKDMLTPADAAAAQVMINDAINDGDMQRAMDLITGLSRKGTELGRAVQILSMQARLTPEGTLRAAVREMHKQADRVIGEGANEGLDIMADELADTIERAEVAARRNGKRKFVENAEFQNKVDVWDTLNANAYIEVGEIPQGAPLHLVGMPSGKMYFDVSKIRKALADHNDHLDPDILKQIPTLLENPVAVVEYQPGKSTNTVNVYGDLYYRGTPVVVGVVATRSRDNTVITKIRTVHARGNFAKQITDDSVLYLGENKNETDRWFQAQGQPVPMRGTTYGFIRSITDRGENVNRLQEALVDDLAATPGNYLSKEKITELVTRVVNESSNIPLQVKRYVTKKIGTGALAERIYEVYKKGHLNDTTIRSAMEQALELPSLTEAEVGRLVDLTTQMNALEDDPVKQADIMDEIYDMLGEKLHVGKLDTLQSWRKFSMLFNLKTHIRNTLSNAVYSGVLKVDNATAQMLERLLLKDPSKRVARMGWRHTPEGQALMPALQKAADMAELKMRGRGKYETSVGVLMNHRRYFKWDWLNKLSDFNGRWLEKEDGWFFRPAFIDALGQAMVARNTTEVTPELEAMALKRAEEATFRADNAISEVLTSLKRFQNSTKTGQKLFGHAVDVVIPFSKTPANIAVQSFYHSPLGLAKGAFDFYNATKGKGTRDAAQAINTMAKGLTGTALLGIGFLLGTLGLFNTGFGKTEKERAADELAGIQENALVIGDFSISLDWLQPAASPLIVGCSMAQRLREEGLSISSVFGSVMDGTDSLFELTMLQSLYDVLGGYDAGASATAGSIAENVVSQSIPTLVGQVARAIDPVQRKTKGDNGFETIINQVFAKIPGLTYLLEPELDVWGNEVYRTGKAGGGSAVLNAFQQFVLPSNVKIATGAGDKVSAEILRLYGDGLPDGASGAVPTAISRDDAANYELDYTDSNRTLGQMNRQAVEEFINDEWPYEVTVEKNGRRRKVTKYYSDMTDEERRKVLSRLYTKAKKQFTDPEDAENDRYFSGLREELE